MYLPSKVWMSNCLIKDLIFGVTHNSYTTVNSGNTRGSSFKLIALGINGANYLESHSAKITLATARKFEYFNGRIKPPQENEPLYAD